MMRLFGMAIALCISIVAMASNAQTNWPAASGNSARLCRGYQETIHGYWLNGSGKPVLGFRFSDNRNGDGCYAWLNAVPAWKIRSAGRSVAHHVQRNAKIRQWGRGKNMIRIDLANDTAMFVRNGRITKGVIDK